MGFLSWLLRRPRRVEALQSPIESFNQSEQSINQSQINQSITKSYEESDVSKDLFKSPQLSHPIELEKDSLQLGIAAGYTGKSLREIESSLNRMESQIVTKDWFSAQFEDKTPELIQMFKQHEENEQKRFEAIQTALFSLHGTAKKAPEPVRTELFDQIAAIEQQLPLTRKMQLLVSIIKDYREISYQDLASKLEITESALRGLLSTTLRRTKNLERFEKEGRGWVRYID